MPTYLRPFTSPVSAAPIHLHGTFIDLPTPTSLRIRLSTELTISPLTGTILSIATGESNWTCPPSHIPYPPPIYIPGLVDTHLHAPQHPNLALKTDLPLMEWLQEYTFPTEARFSDLEYAKKEYTKLVKNLLRHGTTSAVMYASNDLEATKVLARLCGEFGVRAAVGKTASDLNLPENYVETTEGSLRDTRAFVEWCLREWPKGESAEGLVSPVVTPRFVSCPG